MEPLSCISCSASAVAHSSGGGDSFTLHVPALLRLLGAWGLVDEAAQEAGSQLPRHLGNVLHTLRHAWRLQHLADTWVSWLCVCEGGGRG